MIPGLGVDGVLGGADRIAVTLAHGTSKSASQSAGILALRHSEIGSIAGLDTKDVYFLGYTGPDHDLRMASACVSRVRTAIRGFQPDIVHSHLWPSAFTAGLALVGLRIPHVVHIHDQRAWLASPLIRHKLRRFLQASVLSLSRSTLVACSKATADFTRDHLAVRQRDIHVIPNGIDVSTFSQTPQPALHGGPIVLGIASRLAREKGVGDLISACAMLSEHRVSVRLRIAGAGPSADEYRALVARLRLGDSVDFIGPVRNMAAFYSTIDIFALPSLSEGMPLAVLEAMASARPIIASNVAGIPEVVADGLNGYLVPPAAPAALADAILRFYRNPALIAAMGLKARATAIDSFSSKRMVDDFLRLYKTIDEGTHATS